MMRYGCLKVLVFSPYFTDSPPYFRHWGIDVNAGYIVLP